MSLYKINKIFESTLNNVFLFIGSHEKYKNKILDLKKTYNFESNINFNIFTSLSDYYYRENLHSDILKYILDPNTPKIGNKKYIEIFKDYIEIKLNRKIDLDTNTIVIERETNKIDIIIYDKYKNCIFIENKINNANDMHDQIGRYYSKLLKNKFKVRAIIYLTLSPLKKLNKEFSIIDPKIRKEINNFLIEIPVVNKINENNFTEDVVFECINESNNIYSKVYLDEYASLLKYLGGNFMANELNVQAMFKIFKDKETLESFKVLGNLWDNRQKIIANTFMEYFQNELGYSIHSGDNNSVFKKIKNEVNIGFYNDFSFGFVHTPDEKQINSSNKKIFKELLENECLKKYFTNDKVDDNGYWVYKMVDYDKINCFDDLKNMEEELIRIINKKL